MADSDFRSEIFQHSNSAVGSSESRDRVGPQTPPPNTPPRRPYCVQPRTRGRDPRLTNKHYIRVKAMANSPNRPCDLPVPKFTIDAAYVMERTGVRMAVFNLNNNIDEDMLSTYARKYGAVEEVLIYTTDELKSRKRHLCIAHVTFGQKLAAQQFKLKMNGEVIVGKQITVVPDYDGALIKESMHERERRITYERYSKFEPALLPESLRPKPTEPPPVVSTKWSPPTCGQNPLALGHTPPAQTQALTVNTRCNSTGSASSHDDSTHSWSRASASASNSTLNTPYANHTPTHSGTNDDGQVWHGRHHPYKAGNISTGRSHNGRRHTTDHNQTDHTNMCNVAKAHQDFANKDGWYIA